CDCYTLSLHDAPPILVDGIVKAGGRAACHVADVTDEGAVHDMVASAVRQFGRLDILVNNAAVRDATRIDDIDLATWKYVTGIILDRKSTRLNSSHSQI